MKFDLDRVISAGKRLRPSTCDHEWLAGFISGAEYWKDLVADPDYMAMFGAAIASLAEISDLLGIDEESAACANGNELILEAIQRKNEALLAAVKKP